MMSGMLAALTSNPSSRNPELAQHCERLVVRLQDPYLRALLTRLAVREWAEVLEEDSLPLRERLAIAFQFLDDKEVSSYLRRIADRAIQEGDIHGLFVTGLTATGMELLQAYIDSTGDVQTACLISALSPVLARESRATRWMNAYRDMLDGWRLFHHRCHLDTERGKILKEAVEGGEIQPFDWAPKQMLLRCNYCNKPIEVPFPAEGNPRVSRWQAWLAYVECIDGMTVADFMPELQQAAAALFCVSHDAKPRARKWPSERFFGDPVGCVSTFLSEHSVLN